MFMGRSVLSPVLFVEFKYNLHRIPFVYGGFYVTLVRTNPGESQPLFDYNLQSCPVGGTTDAMSTVCAAVRFYRKLLFEILRVAMWSFCFYESRVHELWSCERRHSGIERHHDYQYRSERLDLSILEVAVVLIEWSFSSHSRSPYQLFSSYDVETTRRHVCQHIHQFLLQLESRFVLPIQFLCEFHSSCC
jgi:hypothetical protein